MKCPCKYSHLANLNLCAFALVHLPTFAVLPRHFSFGKSSQPTKKEAGREDLI